VAQGFCSSQEDSRTNFIGVKDRGNRKDLSERHRN